MARIDPEVAKPLSVWEAWNRHVHTYSSGKRIVSRTNEACTTCRYGVHMDGNLWAIMALNIVGLD